MCNIEFLDCKTVMLTENYWKGDVDIISSDSSFQEMPARFTTTFRTKIFVFLFKNW